jgi:hypothetical protein
MKNVKSRKKIGAKILVRKYWRKNNRDDRRNWTEKSRNCKNNNNDIGQRRKCEIANTLHFKIAAIGEIGRRKREIDKNIRGEIGERFLPV